MRSNALTTTDHPWWARAMRFLTTLASGAAAEPETAEADPLADDDDSGVFGGSDDDEAPAEPAAEAETDDETEPEEEAEEEAEPEAEEPEAEAEPEAYEAPEMAQLLQETWAVRLDRMAASGEHGKPTLNVNVAELKPSKAGLARFKAALEAAGDDAEAQMAAAFEASMDAILQVLPLYHQHLDPQIENATMSAADVRLSRDIERFHATPEGEAMLADNALRARMEAQFDTFKAKYGWRRAMQVPMTDYYRMAGGKKGAKPAAAAKSPPPDANDRKRAALGAASAPRGRRASTPASPRKPGSPEALERESADFIRRSSRPLFTVE